MPADTDIDTHAEVLTLRTLVRDLVALSAMQSAWVGRQSTAVAAALADALTELLDPDFVFVRLRVPSVTGAVDVTRGTAWPTFPQWLEDRLARGDRLPDRLVIPSIDDSQRPCRGVVIPIGVDAEGGVIAVACVGTDFPTVGDQLLLTLAANQAAAMFQSARLKEHRAQMWFLESLDKVHRATQGTSDLDRMMGDVLDVVLATFGCDRAWLVYPCDPEAFHRGDPEVPHRVRVERTRPEYIGARAVSAVIPNDQEAASLSRIALASTGPVRFGPESDHAVPAPLAEHFSVRSMIAMAVYPKADKPYLFGLHQCSYPRIWTDEEERLFHEIGQRLADALDMQLMFRNLRQSERRIEQSRAELAASRARIVTAADEMRRKIERDLHDGVQQRLISLMLAQRSVADMAPSELQPELFTVIAGLKDTLEELQEISRGIHPAILAQSGLAPALRTLARRSAVPVELEVDVKTRLAEPVEVAAYYVVSEALTNTAKHAHASAVRVSAQTRDGVLELRICDDGRGGADPARGSGLVGLADRVDALAGTIEVASPVGAGTTLHITLPLEGGDKFPG